MVGPCAGFHMFTNICRFWCNGKPYMVSEPLQVVELVKEKTVEFPSYSIEYLDDVIGGDDPDLDPMIYNIKEKKI